MTTDYQEGLSPSPAVDHIPSAVHAVIKKELQVDSLGKNSFFIADETFIHSQLKLWETKFGDVQPFYAVKCNDNPRLLSILASLGLGFDCASESEIRRILDLGVEPSRILYAAPFKIEDHIIYAKEHGVVQTVFDSEDELRKVARYFPEAQLYLRLFADDPTARVPLGDKFGVRLPQAQELLTLSAELGMKVVGFCFHVGSNATDFDSYRRALELTREAYDFNNTLGDKKHSIHTIDIGGGFSRGNFGDATDAVYDGIEEYFGDQKHLRWVAEPGRFFADETFHLMCRVIGTRPRDRLGNERDMADVKFPVGDVCINDGVYHNFLNALTEKVVPKAKLLDFAGIPYSTSTEDEEAYVLWGQTCDSFDKIQTHCMLPRRAKVGDWLYFPYMGAYTHVTANDFNGFPKQKRTIWIHNSSEDTMSAVSIPLRTLKSLRYYMAKTMGSTGMSPKNGRANPQTNGASASHNTKIGLVNSLFASVKTFHVFPTARQNGK